MSNDDDSMLTMQRRTIANKFMQSQQQTHLTHAGCRPRSSSSSNSRSHRAAEQLEAFFAAGQEETVPEEMLDSAEAEAIEPDTEMVVLPQRVNRRVF